MQASTSEEREVVLDISDEIAYGKQTKVIANHDRVATPLNNTKQTDGIEDLYEYEEVRHHYPNVHGDVIKTAVIDRGQQPRVHADDLDSEPDDDSEEDYQMRRIDRSTSLGDRRPSHPVSISIPTRTFNVAERQPQFVHILSRSMKYPFSDVRRFYFPDFKVDWNVSFKV